MPTLFITIEMRKLTNGAKSIEVAGITLRDAVSELNGLFPGIQDEIFSGTRIRPGLAAVIDGEQTVEGPRAKLKINSEVHFLKPISGGC